MIQKRTRRGRDGKAYHVFRVRWRDSAGEHRSKTLPRGTTRQQAEDFERRVVTLKRIGRLDDLDRGRQLLADFAEEWWEVYAAQHAALDLCPRDRRALRRTAPRRRPHSRGPVPDRCGPYAAHKFPGPRLNRTYCALQSQALVRTRTGDPFLTMEVLYQLSYEGVIGEGIAPFRPA